MVYLRFYTILYSKYVPVLCFCFNNDVYVSPRERKPRLPQIHSCTKAVCSRVVLPFQISDCWRVLLRACRQNIIQVRQKRRKTKSITANTAEDGVAGWWWQFLFFNNVATTREGPGCQDVEDIWWNAGERCFHCWRQSSCYLTFTLSCRQFAGNLWFSGALPGKNRMWLK